MYGRNLASLRHGATVTPPRHRKRSTNRVHSYKPQWHEILAVVHLDAGSPGAAAEKAGPGCAIPSAIVSFLHGGRSAFTLDRSHPFPGFLSPANASTKFFPSSSGKGQSPTSALERCDMSQHPAPRGRGPRRSVAFCARRGGDAGLRAERVAREQQTLGRDMTQKWFGAQRHVPRAQRHEAGAPDVRRFLRTARW
jgi:hypothetical protein